MRSTTTLFLSSALALGSVAQTNVRCTSDLAHAVMRGEYDPADFAATDPIVDHGTILCDMQARVSPDSLKSYLVKLETFHTRNTYSDTVSETRGIGAARRWIHSKFEDFGARSGGRLVPAYLRFDWFNGACGTAFGWKNVLAVLPGTDTTNKDIIIIEGHFDSRCEGNCDVDCYAPGMDDNGSGTALVIELARVMSRYSFRHTIVFMATTGEEQGLYGASAMAKYCIDEGIGIKGVLNNDIVGGVICGNTSSAPSCPVPNEIDSTRVRLFSSGAITARHRGLARTVKMYYEEKLLPNVAVPMTISVIDQEDRTGRGGDHQPFRNRNLTAIRFTSAHEHGNANVGAMGYVDRQHTGRDILGVDTDGDLELDSFYVDFNYLARNVVINGTTAALMAQGPAVPEFILHSESTGLRVEITSGGLPEYRIGVRNTSVATEFDALYRTSSTSFVIPNLDASFTYYVSVAGIDADRVMSPFSREFSAVNLAATPSGVMDDLPYAVDCETVGIRDRDASPVTLLGCRPNPHTGQTMLLINVTGALPAGDAHIVVTDLRGRQVDRVRVALNRGPNEVVYDGRLRPGAYFYSLVVAGQAHGTGKMVVVE